VESKRRRLLAGESVFENLKKNLLASACGGLAGKKMSLMQLRLCGVACEEQLETLKREYLPTLAKEHGVQKELCTALRVWYWQWRRNVSDDNLHAPSQPAQHGT
jgi:hypothetical protein